MLLQSPEEVLQAHHGVGEGLDQASDQRQREADLSDRRDVIEVDLEPVVAHAFDRLGEEAEQALLAWRFVIERGQHQYAAAAQVHRVLGQHHRVGQRTATRARHQLGWVDALVDQLLEQLHAFIEPQRVAFAGGAEGGEPRAPLFEQPVAMLHEAAGIRDCRPRRTVSAPALSHPRMWPAFSLLGPSHWGVETRTRRRAHAGIGMPGCLTGTW